MHSNPKRPKEFASVEHLSHEAVAAYVDKELSPGAVRRAEQHLLACWECRAEVDRQSRAAAALQTFSALDHSLHAPSDLVSRLAGLEHSCPQGPKACLPPDASEADRLKAVVSRQLGLMAKQVMRLPAEGDKLRKVLAKARARRKKNPGV